MRTNAGRDFQARVMGDPENGAEGVYSAAATIALSTNGDAPDEDNTALPGRITEGGLAPGLAAYSHTDGTDTYTLTRSFTFPSSVTIQKVGVEQPDGTLVYEALLDQPVSGVSGDTVQITVTVTV